MAVQLNEDIIRALLKRESPDDWSEDLRTPFNWQGGAGVKRRAGDRQQKVTNALYAKGMDASPVNHWTEGAARVVSALAGVYRENKHYNALAAAALQEQQNREREINDMTAPQAQPQGAPQAPSAPPPSPFAPPPSVNATPFAPVVPNGDGPGVFEAPDAPPVQPSISISPEMAQPTANTMQAPNPATAQPQPPARQLARPSAQDVMGFLMSEGLNAHQAAALTGNLKKESEFNPYAANMTILRQTGRPENSHGMMQWREGRLDGPNGLKAFAAAQGKDWRDWQTQLRFGLHELKTTEANNGGRQFLSAQDVATANALLRRTIRYGDGSDAQRAAYANQFLRQYGNLSPNEGVNPNTLRIARAMMAPREIPAGLPGAINTGGQQNSSEQQILAALLGRQNPGSAAPVATANIDPDHQLLAQHAAELGIGQQSQFPPMMPEGATPQGPHPTAQPQNFMQPDGAQLPQPYRVASLGPIASPQLAGFAPDAPQPEPQQQQFSQVAQANSLSAPNMANDFGVRLPRFDQPRSQPPSTPQLQLPQQRAQEPLPASVRRGLTSPDAAVRAVANKQYEKWLQQQNDKPQYGVIGKDPHGREVYGWIDPRSRATTPNAQFQPEQGPTSEQAAKLRGEIRQLQSYKDMTTVAPRYNSMVTAAARDNRASDLTLVYGLMKLLDPTSVVREKESEMAEKIATIPEQYRASVLSFLTGKGRLPPEVRQAMMQEAHGAVKAYRGAWDNDLKLYRGIIGRQKFNESDIYQDFEPFQEFAPAPPVVAPPLNDIDAELKRRGVQ